MNKILLLAVFIAVIFGCSNTDDSDDTTEYVLKMPSYFGDNIELPSDNPMTVEGIKLGRHLFYEKMLSSDTTISCASCHQQTKAFTDGLRISPGVGNHHTKMNAMSVVNMLWNTDFFWDGRAASLEEQALVPIETHEEMNLPMPLAIERLEASSIYSTMFFDAFGSTSITEERIGKAIAQFERTLISSDSRYDQSLRGEIELTTQEQLGEQLFFTHPSPIINLRGGNCGDCHVNILTSGIFDDFRGFHNNGLDGDRGLKDGLMDVTGNSEDDGKFKTPSLRNIELTAPYMHDGRFWTLEEVVDHYNENVKMSRTLDVLIKETTNNEFVDEKVNLGLTQTEKEAIVAFLKTLTDEEFITNEEFSDPFEK